MNFCVMQLRTFKSFQTFKIYIMNQKPLAVDVLFKAYPMLPFSDGTYKYHLWCLYLQLFIFPLCSQNNFFSLYFCQIQVFSVFTYWNTISGWELAELGWGLTEWLERLTASAKVVATVPSSIPASSNTVESETRRMKTVLRRSMYIKDKFRW